MGKSNKKHKNFLLAALERDMRRLKVEVYQDTKYIKTHIPNLIMGVFTLAFFLVMFILFKTKQGEKFAHSAKDMMSQVQNENYLVKPIKAQELLTFKDTNWEFVDIRSPRFYNSGHIEGAKNKSFAYLLNETNDDFWNSSTHKLLYASDEAQAVNAWFLLFELGYKNIHVLEGGYSYWKTNVANNFSKATSVSDEKAKYDYKQIMKANQGAALKPAATSTLSTKPRPAVKRKKKKAAGGCG